MARNQFFGDGNKRTALLMMNGNLIQNGLCPITIAKSHEVEYRTALIGYYESPEQHRIQFFDFLKQEQQTMLKRWGYESQDLCIKACDDRGGKKTSGPACAIALSFFPPCHHC